MWNRTDAKVSVTNEEMAIEEKPRSSQPPKFTIEVKAQITTIICFDPTEESAHWTLQMSFDTIVKFEHTEISIHNQEIIIKKCDQNLS